VLSKMAEQRLISSMFFSKKLLNSTFKLSSFYRNFSNFRHLTDVILEILGSNLL
jgi:hypothetical protein